MNKETQEKRFETIVSECRQIMLSKGDDYAGADRLSNFKVAGAVVGLNAKMNCLNLIGTKVARLGQLIGSNKAAKHESVRDSIVDLINYAMLLEMVLSEEGQAAADVFINKNEDYTSGLSPLGCVPKMSNPPPPPLKKADLHEETKRLAAREEWKAEMKVMQVKETNGGKIFSLAEMQVEGNRRGRFTRDFIKKYGIEIFEKLRYERSL